MQKSTLTALRAGVAPFALAVTLVGAPAFAQNAPAPATTVSADDVEDEGDDVIFVTGSILKRTDSETPAPVAVLQMEQLEAQGINTVAEGLQRLPANGSGMISEGWNNGNNFAAGANAVSLRGLTVQKTLTVFDGLRMAPYPLADDGHRNFVDLSTIPDAVVERVEVLKDGASSTYGADAVAGVVNIITRREIQGLHVNASAGISQEGDGGEQRLDASYGVGDLGSDGFNVYIAGTYRKSDVIWARDRDYPWNTGYQGGICNDAGTSCMATGTRWYEFGVNPSGSLAGSTIGDFPIVAPGSATGVRTGTYQLLNTDCGAFGALPQTLPNSARVLVTTGALAGTYTYPTSICQKDTKQAFSTLRPETERYGFAARATAAIGDSAEAYLAGNYMHVNTYSQLTPAAFPDQTTPSSDPLDPVLFGTVVLPAYVCSAGVGTISRANGRNTSTGCTAANGTLNPNNPFAAAGNTAIIRGRYDLPRTVETNARSLRAAAGIQGTFGSEDEWNYQFEATASEVRLERISENYLIPQRLADVVATGAYNFAQPWLNTQATRDYVSPVSEKVSTSSLWQVSGILGRDLFELPGGDLQGAVGLSYRHEAIDDPSANPANPAHPYDRYFTVNAVGAVGSRNVSSAFFELNAPIVDMLEVNVSGRYDDYSSGQSNFSPKVGAKLTPVDWLMVRGTWSEGFRIPSFNEAFGLPTTGYTTLQVNCTTYAAFCAAHPSGQPAPASPYNTYATGQYSLGRTSFGNAALDPEKSTSWTLGAVIEPMRNLSFTIDYFNIKVKDTISGLSAADQDAVLGAYLTNGTLTGVVDGVTLIPGLPDAAFPTALALPAFVQFPFMNSDQENVEGVDFGVQFSHDFGGIEFSTNFDASYLLKYQVTRADGTVERYDGSLSPCDYTSCSGSPKWRATWSSTVGIGDLAITPVVYYTGGYDLASVDYGGIKGDCEASIGASVVTYQDGSPVQCTTGAQWNADLNFNYQINEKFSVYLNALNFLDIDPKFDPSAAYSIFNYNPAWGQANMVGRYFRVGVKADF